MKLSLSYDASRLTRDYLEQAISAAGSNTSISIRTTQFFSNATVEKLFSLAGDTKSLSADYNGAQIDDGDLQSAVRAAGDKTSISVNTAQTTRISYLLDAIGLAGDQKSFSATFNGAQPTGNNLERAIKASGQKTRISINTAQYLNITHLLSLLGVAGNNKNLSADFNGAQLNAGMLQEALNAAGDNTSLSINTTQALSEQRINSILQAAGDTKALSADFNGAQLDTGMLQGALRASGNNTSLSVNTTQALPVQRILNIFQAAGNIKLFSADFNGSQLDSNMLQEALRAAGNNTSLSVNTAGDISVSTLLDIISAAGNNKKLTAVFDGSSLTSDHLQQAVNAAGNNTRIIVTNAYSTPIDTILDIISSAG